MKLLLGSMPLHLFSVFWHDYNSLFLNFLTRANISIINNKDIIVCGLPRWLSGKESTCQYRRFRFNPWVRKIPWRRKRQPTPVFLPGKPHGQRSLTGYSLWGGKRVRHDLVTKQHRYRRFKMYNRVKSETSPCIPVLSFLITQFPPQGWPSYHGHRSPLRALTGIQANKWMCIFFLPSLLCKW